MSTSDPEQIHGNVWHLNSHLVICIEKAPLWQQMLSSKVTGCLFIWRGCIVGVVFRIMFCFSLSHPLLSNVKRKLFSLTIGVMVA